MIPVAIIVILVLLTIFFSIKLFLLYLASSSPQRNPVKAVKVEIDTNFGKIKAPLIPDAVSAKNYTFILDTFDGTANIDSASSSAQIYFIPAQKASFGFLPQVYSMAKASGFDTQISQHQVNADIAEFSDGKRNLQVNINNFNFTYNFSITKDDGLSSSNIPEETTIEASATGFLTSMGSYNEELARGKRNVIYLKFDQEKNEVQPLESPDGANMAEVDYFLPDFDSFPVVTSNYYNSPNYVMIGFTETAPIVIKSQVRIFPMIQDKVGVYPIKSSQQAWENLKSDQGYVVSSSKNEGDIKIKRIYLAYYQPDIYQEYFQPVYVFLGDNKFVAYVTALTNEYIVQDKK